MWQLGLIGMYLWNKDKRLNAFPRSTDIIQVLNELPTDTKHIKVPQDILRCHTHVENKKTRFLKIFFLSVLITRSDLSGVPLTDCCW